MKINGQHLGCQSTTARGGGHPLGKTGTCQVNVNKWHGASCDPMSKTLGNVCSSLFAATKRTQSVADALFAAREPMGLQFVKEGNGKTTPLVNWIDPVRAAGYRWLDRL